MLQRAEVPCNASVCLVDQCFSAFWAWFICVPPPTLTPFELDLSICSRSFLRRCYFRKVTLLPNYLYITIYLYFIYSIVFLLNILFTYNTLYTYTSRNIVLIVGITFSVFLGPDEQWRDFECPIAVWLMISEDHLSSYRQGGYVLLTTNKSPNRNLNP